ncbi:hypothetical protein LB505_007520 [Fusarium chuoi]|nr:hypothetical protein LB505_007520 [Fusarium chuoi]
MLYKSLVSLSLASVALAHGDHSHDQEPMSGPHQGLWYNTLPGDGGTQSRPTPSSPVSAPSAVFHTNHA